VIGELIDGLRGLGRKGFGYGRRKRLQKLVGQLDRSGLLDREWYLQTYPDVRDIGADPGRHYLESGWREGRDPGPNFSTLAYLRANADVARSGVNPLLHYIEHGHAEGRGTSDQGTPIRAAFETLEKFGPAAPCAAFDIPNRKPTRWARAGRIGGNQSAILEVDGLSIAQFGDAAVGDQVSLALAQLAWLSGRAQEPSDTELATDPLDLSIIDAWHCGWGILRLRWVVRNGPVVIRAIQHVESDPRLVGEALIEAELDLLDVRLADPYFPLLFLFTDLSGSALGTAFLIFPSLCRGGLHYPELLALSYANPDSQIDPGAVDANLAKQLVGFRAGSAPLVSGLAVSLAGADGTHPLLQEDFKRWLRDVMRVSVEATGSADTPPARYLAQAISVGAAPDRGRGASRLRLDANMVPSISALVAAANDEAKSEGVAGSIILSASEPSSAATLIHVPPVAAETLEHGDPGLPLLEPNHGALPAALPILALRCARRAISETSLLAPKSPTGNVVDGPGPITWLVFPSRWAVDELPQALEALTLQTGTAASIVFIGAASPPTAMLASRLFGRRVETVRSLPDALKRLDTPLVGYLGAGLVLHDRRTVAILADMLGGPAVLTASAPIVAVERQGEGWFVAPTESDDTAIAFSMSGGVIPVPAPQHFWIGRSAAVRGWFDETPSRAQVHLCSANVSVSRLGQGEEEEALFSRPASGSAAIRTQALFG
jgi:hypothetical protein